MHSLRDNINADKLCKSRLAWAWFQMKVNMYNLKAEDILEWYADLDDKHVR